MIISLFIRNIICALFSTKHNKNIENIPHNNKHILGVTSLWMTIPIYNGLFVFNPYVNNGAYLLSIILIFVCISSTIFWSNPKNNSFFHKADKYFAWLFCIAMILFTIYPGNYKKIELLTFIIIVFLILIFFLLSYFCFIMNYTILQLIAHLCFRYVFYLWSHLILVPTEINFLYGFTVITMGHIIHVILILFINKKINYWISCILLLLWIIFCSNVHNFVSYNTKIII